MPAHFIRKYSLYSVKRGDSAKLVCEAFGTRPIAIQWLRQDSSDSRLTPLAIPMFGTTEFGGSSSLSSSEEVTKFNPFSSSQSSAPLPDERSSHGSEATSTGSQAARFSAFQKDFPGPEERTSFELQILSSELSDSALYVCKISNEFGDDTKNMELTILGNAFCFSDPSLALLVHELQISFTYTFLCHFPPPSTHSISRVHVPSSPPEDEPLFSSQSIIYIFVLCCICLPDEQTFLPLLGT